MKKLVATLAFIVGSLAAPAGAAEKFEPVGDLNCVAAQGTAANAMLCKFHTFKDGQVEVYIALSEQAGGAGSSPSTWHVLKSGNTAYRKGDLEGDFIGGAAGLDGGSLIGKKNASLILQPQQGSGETVPSVIRLKSAK